MRRHSCEWKFAIVNGVTATNDRKRGDNEARSMRLAATPIAASRRRRQHDERCGDSDMVPLEDEGCRGRDLTEDFTWRPRFAGAPSDDLLASAALTLLAVLAEVHRANPQRAVLVNCFDRRPCKEK